MNNRGSHVGMILSLVIFVTFLVFLYTTLEPAIKIQKDKQALLDYLMVELIERFSADLTTGVISAKGGQESRNNCVEINYSKIGITNPEDVNLIVYDEGNNPISFRFEGINLILDKFGDKKEFFKIYYSEEPLNNFAESGTCEKGSQGDEVTVFGQIKTRKHIFKSKIINLLEEHSAGYSGLKQDLKIPSGSEFGFSLTYSNGTIIKTQEGNILTNVYGEEVPIQYMDEKANVNAGFMNVRVW
jgi:hypothetical protein